MEEWDSQSNRLSIDRQDIETEQISKAIYAASELLLDKEGSLNIISELHNLFQYIKFPPVGLGVLRWVEYITTPKYLEKQIESTPISLALIDEVAICHPQLGIKILLHFRVLFLVKVESLKGHTISACFGELGFV